MADKARALVAEGYRTLKVKVGSRSGRDDLKFIEAAAAAVPGDVVFAADANQVLQFDAALDLCKAIVAAELPVQYLEQPLKAADWDGHRALAGASALPIALDESINLPEDVDRAASIGIRFVKVKLCKMAGLQATLDALARARAANLRIIFGNGVQTGIGNHLELFLHNAATLDVASEANGYSKLVEPTLGHVISARGGRADCGALHPPDPALVAAKAILRVQTTVI
jgi:L-alanine-DL-glutamate epimerase-like enolase superfamily enzyme